MLSRLKAVFFDAAGTLIHLSRPVGESYREVIARHGATLAADALERAFRQAWKTLPRTPDTGGPRPEDDKGWWRALVQQVLLDTLPTSQQSDFDFPACFEDLYAHFALPGVWSLYPDTLDVLRSLHAQGIQMGVISNFDRRLHRIIDELQLGAWFSSITISSEVGADKPAPRIFEAALGSLSVGPAQAVHVGDDPRCDRGASAVGIAVFELDRPKRTLRDLLPWLESRRTGRQ